MDPEESTTEEEDSSADTLCLDGRKLKDAIKERDDETKNV